MMNSLFQLSCAFSVGNIVVHFSRIMSDRIKRNLNFLKSLLHSKKKKLRKSIVKVASNDNIDALSEAALNTLRGNVPLTSEERRKLKPHSEKLRALAHKKTSIKKKKSLLIQEGGFLPLLLPPLLSAAGAITGRAIATAVGI
jgi:hypothetical protein